jgi:hypothetical protein
MEESKPGRAASIGGSSDDSVIRIKEPLVIMFAQDGDVICRLHPRPGDPFQGYSLLACDLVRHIAACFNVDEDHVWEWIDKERHRPTTTITRVS